jgi:hypothetical protein
MKDLIDYRITLLSRAHIVDDFYQHLVQYDVVSFYYQYYKIIEGSRSAYVV